MLTMKNQKPLEDEQILYQSVVDDEFCAELVRNPEMFDIKSNEIALPDAIEPPDRTSWEQWNDEIAALVGQCSSTCSFGPFTIICDGTTK
jgi:hypothetical protein